MRFAVISDLHANLEAVQAVLADIRRRDAPRIYCLGDLVNYGPDPAGVVDLIRSEGIPCVMGNHDWSLGNALDVKDVPIAPGRDVELEHASYAWTAGRLTDDHRAFLRQLPHLRREQAAKTTVTLVHATPASLTEYVRPGSPIEEWEALVKEAAGQVVFLGHTHLPFVEWRSGALVCNAGSVGRPKDGNPAVSYALAEVGAEMGIDLIRVEYDVKATAEKIRRSGLPPRLADSLLAAGDL